MAFDLDPKFFEAAEANLKAYLPASYRKTMLECNGGEVVIAKEVWQLHPVFDQADLNRIASVVQRPYSRDHDDGKVGWLARTGISHRRERLW